MLLREERAGVEIRVDPKRLEEALERDHPASGGDPKHGSGRHRSTTVDNRLA
jgi:hypothetical protein